MNICVFTCNFLPNLGGVERYVYNMSMELVRRGHHVTIVTSNTLNLESQEEMNGIRIFRLPCFNLLGGRFPILKYNKQCKKLLTCVDDTDYKFCIITPRFYLHSLLGARFAFKRKIPSLIIEHGTGHFTVNNFLLDFIGRIYEHFISICVKHYAKDFAGVSEACIEWLKHFRIKTDLVLYNAVNIDEINRLVESEDTTDYRKKYNISDSDTLIVYTGRMIPEKGVLKLYQACQRAKNAKRIFLLAAGTGELFDQLIEKKNKHFIPLGMLDFAEVIALLKQGDIFCLPTDFSEGFPTSVLEAVAAKCYVITTSSGGSKELITDQSMGTILTENTIEELTLQIDELAKNRPGRKRAAQKAYDKLCDKFTWEKTVDQLLEFIESRISKQNKSFGEGKQ